MDGPRALMSGDGAPGFQGRPCDGMDHGAIGAPTESRSKFSSWIGRLAGTRERRGSIGFTADGGIDLNTSITRMDDDSNSGLDTGRGVTQYREEDGGVMGAAIPFGKKREQSFSDLQTPGGDGDTFIFNYRRRNSIEYSQDAHLNSIKESILFSDPEPAISSLPTSLLQTLHEGKLLQTLERPVDDDMEVDFRQPDILTASHYAPGAEVRGRTEEASSIFLIDIETEDGKIKPTSKKFSATNLLQGKLLQNWFFRNGSGDEEERDGYHEDQDGETSRRNSRDKSSTEEREPEPLSFLGKFRAAVEKHPKPLREMNTWQPQGY